jgi:putative hydrolase of the HAD superfamily
MTVSVVLFDLGNVVFQADMALAYRQWARASGQAPGDFALAVAQAFASDPALGHAFEIGALTPADFHRQCCARLGLALDQESFEAGWNAIFGPATPGIDALLAALAERARLAVFSNTNAVHQRVWERRYAGTLARFERVFTSHGLGRRKPEPAAFAAVAAALGVAPGAVLFLDDAPANVSGARAAGMQAAQWRGLQDGIAAARAQGLLDPERAAEVLAAG